MTFAVEKHVRGLLLVLVVLILLASVSVYNVLPQWTTVSIRQSKPPESTNSLYTTDYLGYIYPKGYFELASKDRVRQFHNFSLKGRHADTVMPKCNHPDGLKPSLVKDVYKMSGPFKYLKNFKNPCWYENGNHSLLRCVPYFYFIGTPKAGTTDLFWRITKHPHVASVSIKEKRWFDTTRFLSEERSSFKYYVSQFAGSTKQINASTQKDTGYHYKIFGDGSPSHIFNNNQWFQLPGNEGCLEPRVVAMSHIHHLLPQAKLILIVRNPVDRLYSDYQFNFERTGGNRSADEFHQWAKFTIRIYTDCFKTNPFRSCLFSKDLNQKAKIHSFSASIYSRLLLDVLKLFPRNQLLVLQTEDYSANMADRLQEVFRFLGLDPLSESRMKQIIVRDQYNKGKNYQKAGPMFPHTRKMIYKFYKHFNEELAEILNDDKYLWLED